MALVAYVMISPQRTVSNYCSPSQIWRLLLTAHVPTAHCLLIDVLYDLGTNLQWRNANTHNPNTKNALPNPKTPTPKHKSHFIQWRFVCGIQTGYRIVLEWKFIDFYIYTAINEIFHFSFLVPPESISITGGEAHTVTENQDYNLTCTAEKSNPEVSILWKDGGAEVCIS